MTDAIKARELLTDAELALYDASLSEEGLRKLEPTQLRRDLQRARQLRDKARDTYRRQIAATRQSTGSKRGIHDIANQRTRQKAQILANTVARMSDVAQLAAKAKNDQDKQ